MEVFVNGLKVNPEFPTRFKPTAILYAEPVHRSILVYLLDVRGGRPIPPSFLTDASGTAQVEGSRRHTGGRGKCLPGDEFMSVKGPCP